MNPLILLTPFGLSLALTLPAAAAGAEVQAGRSDCTVETISPQGERRVSSPGEARAMADGRNASASAAAASRGTRSSSSSVSASSSSRGGASSSARATSTDAQGRTITTIHDGERCTIIVDERAVAGEMP